MSITAKELSKKLGISEAAVSMALHGKPGVSTATRKKVMETAKKHGYDFSKITPNEEVALSKGSIYFVIYRKHGAVVTDTPFFSQLSEGISIGCRHNGFHLNIHYLYEDDDIEETLTNWKQSLCRGMILLGTEMNEYDVRPFIKCHIPMVLLDNYFENINVDSIAINNVQGAYLATCHLIRKRQVQPGYLHSSYAINNFDERADGFYKAIRKNGMSTSQSIVHRLSPSVEGAYADMSDLIAAKEPLAKAYFADNDLIAAGCMHAFTDAGYRIPEDIAIIGFDNMPLCTYGKPALSTVNVPKQYMGEFAAGRLAQVIANPHPFAAKTEIGTTLVERDTICLG